MKKQTLEQLRECVTDGHKWDAEKSLSCQRCGADMETVRLYCAERSEELLKEHKRLEEEISRMCAAVGVST